MQRTIFIFFFLFTIFSYTQTTIKGIVRDSLGVVTDAHIVNLTSKKGTITNDNGAFEIIAKLGDEIEISSIQHNSVTHTVANITLKTRKLDVLLKRKVYELKEFELKKNNLAGFLTIDINAVPKDNFKKVDAVSLGLPFANSRKLTQIERKLHQASSSSGGIPLNFILNSLNGKLRKLKEEARLISENEDIEYIYRNYRFFIQSFYKIKDDELYRFIYYCITDKNYNKNNLKNEIRMIPFLKEMSQEFKKEALILKD